jgi:hypothetical protein
MAKKCMRRGTTWPDCLHILYLEAAVPKPYGLIRPVAEKANFTAACRKVLCTQASAYGALSLVEAAANNVDRRYAPIHKIWANTSAR